MQNKKSFFDMLEEFWDNQKVLISFTGFTAALAALFLNVAPTNNDAKTMLANIQVFWLLILVLSLTTLFVRCLKTIFNTEKTSGQKRDIPTSGYFTLTAAIVFSWIVLNFLGYILSSYPGPFTIILLMTSGAIIIGLFTWAEYAVHDHIEKFSLFSEFMIESFGLAVAGTYGVVLTEALFFKGQGLNSIGWIGVWIFVVLFLLSLSTSLRRGRNIFISRAHQDMTVR
jgi:hypothetical protein